MKIEKKRILNSLFFPTLFIAVLWIVWLTAQAMEINLSHWGIFPRETSGLLGVITSPFVHANIKHLFSNSVPLLVLSWCLFYFYKDLGYGVFPILWILSGFLTWILGRYSYHIGASGLIYSLTFFLFFSGVFRLYVPLLAISLMIVFLYGSTLWGIFPIVEMIDPSVSWEGHLAGAISGLLCALIFIKHGPQKPKPALDDEEDEPDNGEWNEYSLIQPENENAEL